MAKLTPLACRAGRALLEMSARELGERAGVAFETINKFENGRPMRESTKAKIAFVLESLGVEILNGNAPGARLRTGLVPDDPELPPDQEALFSRLAKQVEFLDALEDAGIDIDSIRVDLAAMKVSHSPIDLSNIEPKALRRLMVDPRFKLPDDE
jgi:transcriptional regulator with XRE-family HTH domain